MASNHNEWEELFQTALNDFENGNYRSALMELVSLHQNGYRCYQIKEILDEACYEPNMAEMKTIFEKNVALLSDYPYILGWDALLFEELPLRLYMMSDTEFYIYNIESSKFIYLYHISRDPAFDNCLKNFEENRSFDNEIDFSKIAYITRNIRKSENLGMENHIFLNYDSIEDFLPLLLVNDLTEILWERKLVLSIGDQHKIGPENFSTVFGTTYNQATAKELTLEEIQRIIFGWKIANVTGTSFLADIMDFHPNLLTIPDCFLNDFYPYYMTYLKDKMANQIIPYLQSLPDKSKEKAAFYHITHTPETELSRDTYKALNRVKTNQLLKELLHILPQNSIPTLRQWVSGIYLAFARCHNRDLNTRIIPAVFMYPHDDMFYLAGVERKRVEFYLDMVQSYPDYKVIAIIRDPVTQAGSVIRFMTETHPMAKDENGNRRLDPFYCVAFGSFLPKDYLFPNELPLRNHISIVRFEDLKLNPEATLESLTNFLDLPMCDTLYKTTWCGYTRDAVATDGAIFQGFDPKPIYNQHNKYFSIFDKYRIEMLLSSLMRFYGYEPIYFEGENFSKQEKFSLFQYPFRFESMETLLPVEAKKSSRNTGLKFINMAISIYAAAENGSIKISGTPYSYSFIPWLRPEKKLLKNPIYKTRNYPTL